MLSGEAKKRAQRRYRWKVRRQVLCHYGPGCSCCGEKRDAFLQLNHVKGGGNVHRREVTGGAGGWKYYVWLRKNGYPTGLETICGSCHAAISVYGNCPHSYDEKLGEWGA